MKFEFTFQITALIYAVDKGNESIVKLLLKRKDIDVNCIAIFFAII